MSNVARGYTHTQLVASDTWTIKHNLACIPVVQVYIVRNALEQRALPKEVVITDDNNLVIQFSQAETGKAVIM